MLAYFPALIALSLAAQVQDPAVEPIHVKVDSQMVLAKTESGDPELIVTLSTLFEKDELFPSATAELVIGSGSGDESPTMAYLVAEYGRITAQTLTYSEECANILESTRVQVSNQVVVPKGKVQAYFEGLLVERGFVLRIVRASEPRLLAIDSLMTRDRNTLRADALFVPESDLSKVKNHPAVLFTTSIHMPNSDVRQLSNSMRAMVTDPSTQQLLPAGSTNTVICTGFGDQLFGMVTLLQEVDSKAASDSESITLERFKLEFADAHEATSLLAALLPAMSGQGQQQAGRPGGSSSLRIVPDGRTNAVLVLANGEIMQLAREAMQMIDIEK